MIVAIQGAPGSFSEGAARRLLGGGADMLACDSFDELFAAVASGRAERGVVPVRNSIAGPVYDNAERVRSATFSVVGGTSYAVRQCLITRPGTNLSGVRRVASHPVALRQCTRFFDAHPACVRVAVADTAGGVRDLMLGTLAVDAVIGSAAAAARYGAQVLIEGVEDHARNFTEFVVVARRASRSAARGTEAMPRR